MSVVTAIEPTPTSPVSKAREAPATTGHHRVQRSVWYRLEAAAASARGLYHDTNEDAHSVLDDGAPVYVVADGVGGGAMASQASRKLVSHLHAVLAGRRVGTQSIRNALLGADSEVAKSIARTTDASGAATVALCAGANALLSSWYVAWVGDCRAYRIGIGAQPYAEPLTLDDTYRNLGETPPPGGSPDDPARMIGNGAVSAPNVERLRLRRGEMLVICSDGVHKHVRPLDMSRVLREDAPLARRCDKLVALARANGSVDDATVLAIHRTPRSALLISLAAACALVVALAVALLAIGA